MPNPIPTLRELLDRATKATPADASMETHAAGNWERRRAWDQVKARLNPEVAGRVLEALIAADNALAGFLGTLDAREIRHSFSDMAKAHDEIESALSLLNGTSPEQK